MEKYAVTQKVCGLIFAVIYMLKSKTKDKKGSVPFRIVSAAVVLIIIAAGVVFYFTYGVHPGYDITVIKPTCTDNGYSIYKSKKDNSTQIKDIVKAKGHIFGEWIEIKKAVGVNAGERSRLCKVCGFEEKESYFNNNEFPRIMFYGSLGNIGKKDKTSVAAKLDIGDIKFDGYATLKYQGHSSLKYPKKNFTVKFYEDESHEKKKEFQFSHWNKENKYILKANYIDTSRCRNLICADIWAKTVSQRKNLDKRFKNLSNYGAGKCGDTVQIGVRLENNPGVLAMHFDLEYDTERLKLVNAVDGALLDGAVFSQTFDSYPYIMLWNSASYKNFAQDGLLVNLTFKILDDAKAGDAQINLKYDKQNIFDVDLKDVDINVIGGKVSVTEEIENVSRPSHGGGRGNKNSSGNVKTDILPDGKNSDNVDGKVAEQILFSDVKNGDWFFDAVRFVYDNNLMVGTEKTQFSPHTFVTRAMLVTVLYRMDGEKSGFGTIFSDVSPDSVYANPIGWAYENKIVNGISDSEFAPDFAVTREQAAAILYRYAQFKGANTEFFDENLPLFGDFSDISDYAVIPVKWAVSNKILNGKPDIKPLDFATRAEIAAILMRFADITG